MGMTWSEYKIYRQKKKKEEQSKKEEDENKAINNKQTSIPSTYKRTIQPSATQTISNNNKLANNIMTNITGQKTNLQSVNLAKKEELKNQKLERIYEDGSTWGNVVKFFRNTGRAIDNLKEGAKNGIIGAGQSIIRDVSDIENFSSNASRKVTNKIFSSLGDKGKVTNMFVDVSVKSMQNKRNEDRRQDLEDLQDIKNANTKNIQKNIFDANMNKDPIGTKLTELAPSMGQQLPGYAMNTVLPGSSLLYFKLSSEANYYDDAKERGMTEGQSKVYSKLMSWVEAGTEQLSVENIQKGGQTIKALSSGTKNAGLKNGLKAGIDVFKETAKEETANSLKEGLKNYGIGIAEEAFQEAITEPIQEFTAMKVAGEDKADWNNMWQRMLQSGFDGALSSAIIAGANMGVSSCQGIVTKIENGQEISNQEYNKAVKDASKKVNIEKLATDGIKNEVSKLKSKMLQNHNIDNKVINQEQKTSQNGFSEAEKTESLRQEARNKLESIKQNYDENSYNQMQEFIETAPSEKALNQVINDLNKEVETKQVAPINQKQEVQLPMKQETQNRSFEDVAFEAMSNYESNEVESPLKNRDMSTIGKQTKVNAYQYDNPKVKPYFQEMAQQMGEDLAYISSSDNRSTQKGGGTKLSATTKAMDILHNEQGYSYNQIAQGLQNIIDDKGSENNAISKKIELVIDEQLRNGYTNALGKNIEPNQEYINTIQQNQKYSVEQPQMQEQIPAQNVVIDEADNLITSAEKYNLDFKKISIQNSQKALEKRGIKARFDESYFNSADEGGKYILTTDDDGKVISREIVLNPKANEHTILQEMAIHELTHDLIASKTQESKDLYNSVLDYLKKDADFETKRNELAESYLQIKDQDGNYVYSREQKGFDNMIDEEAVAKALQTKFGTQEEVNRLVNTNRNIAQRIYDWIADKIDTFKNRNNAEYLFWKDVRNKFEKAFAQKGNYDNNSSTVRHYIETVAKFDEMEYNNVIPEELGEKEYQILRHIINTDSNIKPGINYVEVTNGKYTVYYKGFDNFKVMSKETDADAGRINERNGRTGGKTRYSRSFKQDFKDQRTTTSNDEISNIYTKGTRQRSRSDTSSSTDIKNVKDSKESSFNLPENVKDIKNMNEFLRKAVENETNQEWKERLKDAKTANYTKIDNRRSPLQYKREIVQQYLDYKKPAKDNKGRTLSPQQKEYFKDSVVRNDKGELLEVYHGTPNPGFTEFRRNVNYFTDNQNVANTYTGNDGVYKGYVDIQNPIRIDANKEVWSKIDIDNIKIDNIENVKEFLEEHGSSTWREQGKIRTSTADIVSAIEDAIDEGTIDADGIIIENIYDEGAYGSSVGKQLGTDYITFNSNQFKNTDNTKPTVNKDIRYSVSTDGAMKDNKTGKKVVLNAESNNDGKSLLAIHNLTEDKLKGVLELGGFAVPSIAVTNQPHTNFGDISVIFNKNTIDPSLNKANKIYSRDAYTARTPNVVNKIIESGLKEVSKNTGIEEWNLRENYKEISIEDAVEKLRRNENIIDKYLKEKGIEIEPVYRDFKGFTHLKQDSLQDFINQHKELVDLSYTDKYSTDTYKKYYNDVHNLFVEDIMKEAKIPREKAESFYKDYPGFNHWDYFIRDLNAVQELKGKQQLDEYATKEAKEKAVDVESKEYKDYVKKLISPMYGEKYIRNNKDYYTASGTPRSFNQRYEEYTLDNIVKIMNENKGTGQESTWGVGINEIAGDASKRFKNIKDIKNNENLLMTQNEDEHKQILDKYNTEFRDIENSILDKYSESSIDGYVWREKSIEDAMKNIARKMASNKKITEQNVISQFDTNGIKINENQAQRVISLIKNLSNLPTNYFEAKPQRAVGFDEIDAIVIPKDVSKEVKQQLKDRGIKTIEYDRNNENERADILKSLNEYKFSKTNESFDEYLTRRIGKEGTRTPLKDLRLPMKEKQEVKAPMKGNVQQNQENTKVKFDNEVMKTNSEIKGNSETSEKVAKILSEPKKNVKPEQRTWAILKANFIDKGAVFEKISQKTNNRDLQGKYDYTLTAGARGQYAIGNDRYVYSKGKKTLQSKSLTSIMDEVGENTQAFNEYMYHQLNVDRMTLDERFGIENKPVFGESITADVSRTEIAKIEEQHPEFKEYANDVYKYLEANKQELVDRGVISQETSDFFKERYPHYVPIQRATRKGNSIDVALDTKRTGINSPIKKAKGGNQDINPLFQTMASQTLQTYRASARNNFGLELKNTLQKMNQLNENRAIADIDDIVDTMTNEEQNNELLQPGKKGENPTFTVFEDGKKITYDISQDMYDALKPKSEILNKLDNTKLAKAGRKISNFRRGVLTEYNPIFSITNAIKDAQDVLINSQHSAKTYAKFPEAYAQIVKKGYWYNEYIQNGGEQNSYFTEGDFENIKKTKLDKAKNVLKIPFEKISQVNNVIEMAPRLAEYIVSRQNGANIETAMLDASRVTTNFKAGGDITKFANRNGATFLNASVQGFQQQVRNIQEANMKGLKGWTNLALKYTVAGLPALLLNNLFWDDDDDYEQLQDYVKDNYYVVAKLPNGNFLRIPKGRMVATIQKVVSNANDFVKDGKINSDDVASTIWNDLKEDVSFGMDNLAPNNPIDNNILSPIIQVAQNKTWYGDDLVPQRLQDVPEEEQADETTDKFSKWLGEKLKVSPIKINYLLDQYSGGIGDVLLPLGTPQAENNVIEDKFTTDPVMKSQYPADFFNKRDELNVRNNSLKATDEDKLKYKYISSIQSNISDLYKQKREIQASDKTDKEKKAELKKVQKQINELARESLETVDKVEINGNGAKIGEQEYYKKNGTWTKLTEKEKEKLRNTSMSTYSSYQSQISGKDLKDYEKIQILRDSNYSNEEKSNLYEKTISTDKYYSTLKKSGIDIDEYMDYKLAQSNGDFTADKKNGKTVMGSGKKKVIKYLNNNITGYGNRLLIAGKQYSLSASQRKDLSNYINKTFTTQKERTEVYKQLKLNFVVNGNKVTYK